MAGKHRLGLLVRRTPSHLAEDVDASEGVPSMSLSSHGDIETECAVESSGRSQPPRKREGSVHKTQKQRALCGELDVLSFDSEEVSYVWKTATQVTVPIDVPGDVKVTQFVCEFDNSSILFGFTGETCRTCRQ